MGYAEIAIRPSGSGKKIQRQGGLSRRFSNVSYYGLTTPPYKLDALEPYMSKRTVELHWGKHHQDYMDGLNNQLATSPLYGYTLEDLIKKAYNNDNPLPEYNNTAQAPLIQATDFLNCSFYSKFISSVYIPLNICCSEEK
uniref:superoxide dismutase n=1 Tax=Zea mays TaxID=4577 RepID=A0A804PD21_MAIZE